MPRKLTREEFIKKANIVHNNKYDYSLVEYVNNQTKVKIICPIHDIFLQIPNGHLSGKGCPKCSGKFMDREYFIEKAKEKHGDNYDYSLVEYVNTETKVKIICPIHDIFEQTPHGHLSGADCPKCSGNIKLTTEEFIKKAKEKHGDKYDYSLVEYIDSKTKVKIICPEHDVFEQIPNNHLNGKGCPKCSGNYMDKEYFIEKAKEKHGDKYDYSLVEYVNTETKVKIICLEHDVFLQIPYSHLSGAGCTDCYLDSIKSDFYTPTEFKKYRREVNNLTKRVKIFENWDGYDYYDGEYIRC